MMFMMLLYVSESHTQTHTTAYLFLGADMSSSMMPPPRVAQRPARRQRQLSGSAGIRSKVCNNLLSRVSIIPPAAAAAGRTAASVLKTNGEAPVAVPAANLDSPCTTSPRMRHRHPRWLPSLSSSGQ